jgi:hypothetical protein
MVVMVVALKSFCILKMYLKKDIIFYFKIVFNIFLNIFFFKNNYNQEASYKRGRRRTEHGTPDIGTKFQSPITLETHEIQLL